MPTRSLNSSVLRWPDQRKVDQAVHAWAADQARRHPEVLRIGYFGSYARGDWGVGSDVDLVVVLNASDAPFQQRAMAWDTSTLPVPAEVLVYTESEWQGIRAENSRFAKTLVEETRWVYKT